MNIITGLPALYGFRIIVVFHHMITSDIHWSWAVLFRELSILFNSSIPFFETWRHVVDFKMFYATVWK